MVSGAFVALADTLVDDYDVIELLVRLVDECVRLLPVDAAAIMLADSRERLRVVASTSDDAEMMDLLQLQYEQGPCLDCYRTSAAVEVPDLEAAADRWPRFVATLQEQHTRGRGLVFRSVHAVPLRLRGESVGAMNLFHHEAGALPAADLALGQALADVATIGILQERAVRRADVLTRQLQSALDSRVVIEQAKGILAQHYGLDMNAAFALLRSYSRNSNQRLGEVAQALVERRMSAQVLGGTGR